MAAPAKQRTVVVAIDGSQESTAALRWAIKHHLVGASDKYVLVHVRPVAAIGAAGEPVGFHSRDEIAAAESYQEQSGALLLDSAKKLCEESGANAITFIAMGDAREEICNAVKRFHATLLVVGSHGYGRLQRALLGSVSDYCAHNADCPVLIVKPGQK